MAMPTMSDAPPACADSQDTALASPAPKMALVPRQKGPVGDDAAIVSAWFETIVEIETPVLHGSLAAERDAATAYARMAKAETPAASTAPRRAPGVPNGASRPCPAAVPTSPRSWRASAAVAGFDPRDFRGHSLTRGVLTTGMDLGEHPATLKRLGRHKSFDVLGEYLEFGDLFDNHPLGKVL